MNLAALPLAPRLLLTPVPAIAGIASWSRMNDWFLFETDWYIYLWYPPLMDVLFGVLVLGPFVVAPHAALRVAGLAAASVAVHALSVAAVVHSQWLLDPVLDWRFASVPGVAVAATFAFCEIARRACGFVPAPGYWRRAALAGLLGGFSFLATMEIDSSATSWLYEHGAPWIVWHAAICTAVYAGSGRQVVPPLPVRSRPSA